MSRTPFANAPEDGKPLRAAPLMAVGTALSRLTGFVRLFALAYALGINHLSDAYNLANNTPNIFYDLVAGGVLSATLVPVFVERMATMSEDDANRAMSAVTTVAAVILVGAAILLAVFAPLVIGLYTVGSHASGIGAERGQAVSLLRLMAPQIAFFGMVTLVTAILNARRVFSPPMFVPILNNLVCIAMFIWVAVAFRHPSLSTLARHHTLLLVLGLGTTAGVGVQAAALIPALRSSGGGIRWCWQPGHEAVRRLIALSGWTFGFVVVNQLAYFVILALATHAGSGAVSAYTYSYAFFQLPYGIVAVSVMSAIQPQLAHAWTTRALGVFRARLTTSANAILAIVIPAGAVLFVMAQPITALALGHGAANATSTHSTGSALMMLGLGLPGFCIFLLVMRAFQSMQDTRSVFAAYVVQNVLDVILALMTVGRFGVAGLAFALSLSYTVAAFYAAVQLRDQIRHIGVERVTTPAGRVIGLTVLMTCVIALVGHLAGTGGAAGTGWGLAAKTGVALLAGVSVFVAGTVLGTLRHVRHQ